MYNLLHHFSIALDVIIITIYHLTVALVKQNRVKYCSGFSCIATVFYF